MPRALLHFRYGQLGAARVRRKGGAPAARAHGRGCGYVRHFRRRAQSLRGGLRRAGTGRAAVRPGNGGAAGQVERGQGAVPAHLPRLQPALPLLLCRRGRLPLPPRVHEPGDGEEGDRLPHRQFGQPPRPRNGLFRRRAAHEFRPRNGLFRRRAAHEFRRRQTDRLLCEGRGLKAGQGVPLHPHHQRPAAQRRRRSLPQ